MATIDVLLRVRDGLTPALKAADGAAAKLNSSMDNVARAGENASSRVKGWINEQKASFDRMSAALSDTSTRYPALTRLVGGLTGGMRSLGVGVAGVVGGLGAAAVGMAALGAAAAAVTAGILVGAGAVVYYGKQAQEALADFQNIQPLKIEVDPASQASMDRAVASVDSLRLLAMAAVVALADNLAPVVGQVADTLVGMGLAALKAFQGFTRGEPVIQSLARLFVDVLYESILLPVRAFQLVIAGLGKLAEVVGLPSIGFSALNDTISSGIAVLKDNAVATVNAALGYTGLSDALTGFEESGRALTGQITARTKALEREKEAAKGAEDAAKKAAEAQKALKADQAMAAKASTALGGLEADALKLQVDADALQDAFDGVDFDAITKAMNRSIKVTQATNTITAASSLQGLTAAAGPVGGAVMAGVGAVGDIGKGGGILTDIQTTLADFTTGLKAIPNYLGDAFKNIVTTLIPELIAALPAVVRRLVNAVGDIIEGVVANIPAQITQLSSAFQGILFSLIDTLPALVFKVVAVLLSPKFWLELGKSIATSIWEAIKGIFGKVFGNEEKTGIFQKNGAIAKALRGGEKAGKMRGFASGLDRVGETGVAVIHEGEEIVRKGGSMSAASSSRFGGGVRDIHLHGVMAGDRAGLMREIRQAIREGDNI